MQPQTQPQTPMVLMAGAEEEQQAGAEEEQQDPAAGAEEEQQAGAEQEQKEQEVTLLPSEKLPIVSPIEIAQEELRSSYEAPLLIRPVTVGLSFVCTGQAPVIQHVHVGSPAHDAGLLQGDRILSVSATNMTTTTDVIGVYSDQLSILLKQTFHAATMAGGRMIVEVERFGTVLFVELGPVWSSSVRCLSLSLCPSCVLFLLSISSLAISLLHLSLSLSLFLSLTHTHRG